MEDMKNEAAIDSTLNVDTSANAGDIENDPLKQTINDDESIVFLYGNSCSVRDGGEKLKVTVEETNSQEIGDEEIMNDDEHDDDYDKAYIIGDEEPFDEELLEDPEEDTNYEENDYDEVINEEINKDIMDTDKQDPEEEELEEENVNKEVNEECMKRNDEVEEHVGDMEKGDMKEGDKNVENASKAEMNAEANIGEVLKVNNKIGRLRKTRKLVKMKRINLKGKKKVISSEENLNVEANSKGKLKGKVETGTQGVSEEKPQENAGLENEEKKNHADEIIELKKNIKTFLKEKKLSKLRKSVNVAANNDGKMKGKVETGTQAIAEEKQQGNSGLEDEKKENHGSEIRDLKKKVKTSLKEKSGKLRKRGKKGARSEMIPNNTKDQQPANKKMAKKGTYTGMIFMCSSKTKMDCYHFKVLGLPASKRDLVLNIYEGMKLFLFDFDLKLLYGIYRAAGPGGYNIEPKAFNSGFPSQVRFNISEDCLPLPEEKFKEVIKENYYSKSKFDCQLTPEQVSNLCKLFRASSKALKLKGLNRIPKPEPRSLDGGRSRKRRVREEPRNENRTKKLRYNEERTRKLHQRQGRKSPIRREQRRRGRKAQTPPAVPRALPLPPYPPLALSHPYAYEGERSARLDPLDLLEIRHRERTECEHGRDPIRQHYNGYFRDSEFRHQKEIQHPDPYDRYRDYPLYHDRLYATSGPSSYHQTTGSSLYPRGVQVEYSMYNRYNSSGRGRLWY